jgi:hypothetical protein
MIEVKYEMLDNKCFINYLDFLIGQLYKSLCLKEEQSDTLCDYLDSLKNELIGSKELIVFLKSDARFISMLSKIQYLICEPEVSHKVFKKEIFSCISIVDKLKNKYGGD